MLEEIARESAEESDGRGHSKVPGIGSLAGFPCFSGQKDSSPSAGPIRIYSTASFCYVVQDILIVVSLLIFPYRFDI